MKYNDNGDVYVYFNNEKIISSGISVTEFIKYNSKDINNLLLLDSEVRGNKRNKKYNFYLIEGKKTIYQALSDINVMVGNLCFVDYNTEENINKLSKEEIMHMLYFSQCYEKLDFLINDKIQNSYAYYCHDNDWYITIFPRNIEDYIQTLLNVLTKNTNANEYKILNMNMIIDIIKKGAIFCNSDDKIKIYEVGYLEDPDDIFNKREELVNNNTLKYYLNVVNNKLEISKAKNIVEQ